MNLAPFFTAIKTRIEADTGTGGIWAVGAHLVTGIYSQIAVPNLSTSYPYILIDHAGDVIEDGFGLNMVKRAFRLHVYAEVSVGYAALDAILNRLYGDGKRGPVYGFHRHTLTLASGSWTGNVCEYQDTQFDNDEDYYHAIQTYVTRMSMASTS